MDEFHHFEGYTRADGEEFHGNASGFAIVDTFEGPGTWFNVENFAPFGGSYEAKRCAAASQRLAADHTAFIFEQMSARLHQHPHYQTLACMHVLVEA